MLVTQYTIDIMIALEEGEKPTKAWWAQRMAEGFKRAGGFPPEVAAPDRVDVTQQTDPDSGERFALASWPLPLGTSLGRTRELAHMLTSVLHAEGNTIRADGKREDHIPGEELGPPTAEMGGTDYSEARAYSHRCLTCVFASDHRIGCCGEGCAFSLADVGAILLDGGDEMIAGVLALPGEMDGVKWHPYLAGGKCVFHDPSCGCTLSRNRMPLQCRTYLCAPERLLPPELLVDYEPYVDSLEEAEAFIEEHMREVSGVEFGSPLDAIREAARKAFAAWKAGT